MRVKRKMQPVCAECGTEFSLDVGRRSRKWYAGIVGVRLVLCSAGCARANEAKEVQHG